MIAEKVVGALNDIVHNITRYVQHMTPDSEITTGASPTPLSERPEYAKLKDIELEFVCALANDTALVSTDSFQQL
jgi:hypothetical protein